MEDDDSKDDDFGFSSGGRAAARRLNHRFATTDHILLALLTGDPDTKARNVLVSSGVDAVAYEASLRVAFGSFEIDQEAAGIARDEGDFFAGGVDETPAHQQTRGRAEGLAAWRHEGPPDSIDLLLALLWGSPVVTKLGSLAEQGVSRELIVATLIADGVTVPVAPLPRPPRPWLPLHDLGIPKKSLRAVVDLLKKRYPPGSQLRWGFNYNRDSAWVSAEEGIDLGSIVAEATESTEP